MATFEEIQNVLKDMRTAIDQGKFIPICRQKNMDTLALLGYTWNDVKNEIYTIDQTDYVEGPSVDYDDRASDKLWVFKKDIEGKLIYIKFKIEYQINRAVRVVSFHIDMP